MSLDDRFGDGKAQATVAGLAAARLVRPVEAIEHRGHLILLQPLATAPAQIEDAKAAMRWLRANAEAYRLDP